MIESWIQELVGVKYMDKGRSAETGFCCVGLCRYIIKRRFNLELPDNPPQWRSIFDDLGWPANLKAYDIIVMCNDNDDSHMGIAADERELIHCSRGYGQVVIEPIIRLNPIIKTAFRLK